MTVQKAVKCNECKKKDAQFYSTYNNERVLFCSAPCHEKYNEKVENKNLILVALEKEDENPDKNTDESHENLSEVFKLCHRGDGNYEKLRTLLENDDSDAIHEKNQQGQTLLTYSIVKGDLKTLDVLLTAGADINEADGNGVTPLMVAASIGAEQKVILLLERDADETLQDNEGKTALHKTDINKESDCAKLLLEKNRGLLNIKDNFDQTAVHVVAGEGNDNVLALFLEYEPNLDDLDNLGRTPLICCVLQKAEKCVKLLLDYKDGVQDGVRVINIADRFGFAPIHYAIQANNIELVKLLVEKGCDINKSDNSGLTLLHGAAAYGFTDVCKILLENCEDKNAVDAQGLSALHHAASKGQTEICELLINNGADVNLQDKKQQTCIFRAALSGKEETVKVLIKRGAKCGVSAKDDKERTPLHYVAQKGNANMLKFLIEEGGLDRDGSKPEQHTINSVDCKKSSVLFLAAYQEHKGCCQILIDKGVIIDEPSKSYLIKLGLIEEEKKEEEETSPRERYAAEPAPTPEEEKVDDLPIPPVTNPVEVANNSRHISPATSRRSSVVSEKKKNHRALKQRLLKSFPGHENSPYLMSMLREDVLYENRRFLEMKPAYLSRSCNNLDSSSTSSKSSTSGTSHGRRFSYSSVESSSKT